MKRHLFTLVCVLSLLSWAVNYPALFRSHVVADSLTAVLPYPGGRTRVVGVETFRGYVLVFARKPDEEEARGFHYETHQVTSYMYHTNWDNYWTTPNEKSRWQILDFGYVHLRFDYEPTLRCLRIPPWFLLVGPLVLPGVWVTGAIRRRRRCVGEVMCVKCGYDLRAHEAGQKCPECGTVIEAAAV